jgi:DNA-directed RNA polymerase I subunit RPA1
VVEYDLSRKQKAQLRRKRPDVLLQEQAGYLAKLQSKKPRQAPEDSDVDMSDPESEQEESEEEEQDDEEQEQEKARKEPDLPRAANGKLKTKRGRNERVVTPEECRAHLRRLFRNEAVMCSLLYGRHGPFALLSPDGLSFASADMFFLDAVPVAPTRFRPAAKMADKLFEHPQNELLEKILKTCYRLRDQNLDLRAASQKTPEFDDVIRKKIMSSLLDSLVQLQIDVNSFMDSSKNPAPMRMGKLPPAGVKQGLEKKEGLFRKHMMVLKIACKLNDFVHIFLPG